MTHDRYPRMGGYPWISIWMHMDTRCPNPSGYGTYHKPPIYWRLTMSRYIKLEHENSICLVGVNEALKDGRTPKILHELLAKDGTMKCPNAFQLSFDNERLNRPSQTMAISIHLGT